MFIRGDRHKLTLIRILCDYIWLSPELAINNGRTYLGPVQIKLKTASDVVSDDRIAILSGDTGRCSSFPVCSLISFFTTWLEIFRNPTSQNVLFVWGVNEMRTKVISSFSLKSVLIKSLVVTSFVLKKVRVL